MWNANVWDPALIVSQMTVLQCGFYIIAGLWLWAFHVLFGVDLSLRHLLVPSALNVTSGWPAAVVCVFTAPVLAWLVVPVVGRARQCLDFVGTAYGYHFVFSWIHSGAFPSGAWWWVFHVVALTGAVVLAEFLCMRKEMEAIPSVHAHRADDGTPPGTASASAPSAADARNGHSNGHASDNSDATRPLFAGLRSGNGNGSTGSSPSSSAAAAAAAASDPDRVSLITIEPELDTLLADHSPRGGGGGSSNGSGLLAGLSLASLGGGSSGSRTRSD